MQPKSSHARNLTPPDGSRASSGTFKVPMDPDDEVTSPCNHNAALVQKVIHVIDHLQEDERHLFVMLSEAFDLISKKNKLALVQTAVTMAGL